MIVALLIALQALSVPEQQIERELLAQWTEKLDAEKEAAVAAMGERLAAEKAFYECVRTHAKPERLDDCDGAYESLKARAISAEVKMMGGRADARKVNRYLESATSNAYKIATGGR